MIFWSAEYCHSDALTQARHARTRVAPSSLPNRDELPRSFATHQARHHAPLVPLEPAAHLMMPREELGLRAGQQQVAHVACLADQRCAVPLNQDRRGERKLRDVTTGVFVE